jgi:hypothetical protein
MSYSVAAQAYMLPNPKNASELFFAFSDGFRIALRAGLRLSSDPLRPTRYSVTRGASG